MQTIIEVLRLFTTSFVGRMRLKTSSSCSLPRALISTSRTETVEHHYFGLASPATSRALKHCWSIRPNVNDDDEFGRTALHAAISSQNLSVVEVLLGYDADVTIKDEELCDAISEAAENDNAEIVKVVLEKLKTQGIVSQALSGTDIHGNSPLHKSVGRGGKDVTELFQVGNEAGLVPQVIRDEWTPLYLAV
jgi:hypothetical protein